MGYESIIVNAIWHAAHEVGRKVGMHPTSYQHKQEQENKPHKFEQYKAEIEAVKKRVKEKQVAFNALQKPQKG
ncbi:hypothetical protein [Helicobacter labacensis]|uniref:hypothetical protein n=1 Tax=Helicobacter labacensis TaxID=2316079 RepID=UPI000EAF5B31|nr:hypothetical protein [Helicobacter labacensis]